MSNSLKDALLKVGIKTAKVENERKVKPRQEVVTKSEIHQSVRNFCEVCQTTQPDVERFRHRMPTVDAEWICSNCADKNQIHDKFRVTEQSQFCKTGRYRRFYGPTLKLEKAATGEMAKQNINRSPIQQQRDQERRNERNQPTKNHQRPSSQKVQGRDDDDDDQFNR